MIPKIIHYCWLSGERYPPQIINCQKSWHRYLRGYEFKLWDAKTFDVGSVPYVRRCVEMRKWAFAADYIRLYAVYNYGGIYLDSDVRVLKSFDSILGDNAFWGIDFNAEQGYAFPEAAIFGAMKGFRPLKEMMQYYESLPIEELNDITFERLTNVYLPENKTIYNGQGKLHLVTAPAAMEAILQRYGFRQQNCNQSLDNDIKIYGSPFFLNGTNTDTAETYAHHENASSWLFTNRGPIFHYCHNHPWLMNVYTKAEHLRLRLSSNK